MQTDWQTGCSLDHSNTAKPFDANVGAPILDQGKPVGISPTVFNRTLDAPINAHVGKALYLVMFYVSATLRPPPQTQRRDTRGKHQTTTRVSAVVNVNVC
jgi:hypothetical protein